MKKFELRSSGYNKDNGSAPYLSGCFMFLKCDALKKKLVCLMKDFLCIRRILILLGETCIRSMELYFILMLKYFMSDTQNHHLKVRAYVYYPYV